MGIAGLPSVPGAHGLYQTLHDANVALAQQVVASINSRVLNGQLPPANNGTAPTVPAGANGALGQGQYGAFLTPGNGMDTLFSGSTQQGSAPMLDGSGATTIFGGSGTGTIAGGQGVGRHIAASSGNASLTGSQTGGSGNDLFAQISGESGNAVLQNFGNTPLLQGLAQQAQAGADPTQAQNGTTITLSDNSKITFAGANSLDPNQAHIVPPHGF